jgi:alpha-tubulin suppressor-like RCC1 family protein
MATDSDGGLLALKTDGSLWQWRGGADGKEKYASPPIAILGGITRVSAGGSHYLALQEDGTLYAWGHSGYFDSSQGIVGSPKPVAVMENIEQIYAGDGYSLAVDTEGALWAWGRNDKGQVGDGTRDYKTSPVKIVEDVAFALAASETAYAVKADGSLWGWGAQTDSIIPKLVMEQDSDASIISLTDGIYAGGKSTYILKSDYSLYAIDQVFELLDDWGGSYTVLQPKKLMDDVLYVDGGHAVKTDGSIWDAHRDVMILPPGTALTGR